MKKAIQLFENMSQKSGETLRNTESSSTSQGNQRKKEPMVGLQRANENQNCLTTKSITRSITHCPIDLNMRSLVLKANFTMLGPLKYEAMVFFFEDIVIFTQQATTSTGEQQYVYVDSIEMDDLSIETFEFQSLFHLINFSKIKDNNGLQQEMYTYILQSSSMHVKENWVQCIENTLWEQLKQCKGQQKHAKGTSLTDDGGNVRVKTLMGKSPVDKNSPNFQLSQVLRDGTKKQSDATNMMEHCPVVDDLPLQKPVKMTHIDEISPNLQLSQVLLQGLKNQNRDQSHSTKTAKLTDDESNARAKTPMEKSPIYENASNFQFGQVLRDGTKNHDDANNITNSMKYCSEQDLPPPRPIKMAPVDGNSENLQLTQVLQQGIKNQNPGKIDSTNAANSTDDGGNERVKTPTEKSPIYENSANFQLSQVLRDGTNNHDDANNITKSMKYCAEIDLPVQRPIKKAPIDKNSPNLQLSLVLQQGMKKQNRDQTGDKNAASSTDDGGNARVKTAAIEKSPIYENSRHFQIGQVMRDGTKNHDDANDITNSMKYCSEHDLPPPRPMKMAHVDKNSPNLQLTQVMQQGMKNQYPGKSDSTNAANLTDDGGNGIVKTPIKKSPIYENSSNFQLNQVLRDGTKNHDDGNNITNSMKYCPEMDLPPPRPARMAPVDTKLQNLQLSQVMQQGVKSQNRDQDQSETINALNSIKYCPVNLHLQGSLLIKDVFSVHKPKRYEAMVFLFEEMIVFTSYQEGTAKFTHVDHIKISHLSIPSSKTPPTMLHLSDYTKVRNGEVNRDMFVLEAKSTNVKDNWDKAIEKQLWSQLEQVKRDYLMKPM